MKIVNIPVEVEDTVYDALTIEAEKRKMTIGALLLDVIEEADAYDDDRFYDALTDLCERNGINPYPDDE